MRLSTRPLIWLLAACAVLPPFAQAAQVRSPDGRIAVTVDVGAGGIPEYSAKYDGAEIMPTGKLGMRFAAQPAFDAGFRVASTAARSHDQTWEQPWGERRFVRDRHNELQVDFEAATGAPRRFTVRVRVFDDGFGFRYEVPRQPGYDAVSVTDELTEFRLDHEQPITAWWIPGRRYNRYEYLYHTTGLEPIHLAHTPMTVRLPTGVHHVGACPRIPDEAVRVHRCHGAPPRPGGACEVPGAACARASLNPVPLAKIAPSTYPIDFSEPSGGKVRRM